MAKASPAVAALQSDVASLTAAMQTLLSRMDNGQSIPTVQHNDNGYANDDGLLVRAGNGNHSAVQHSTPFVGGQQKWHNGQRAVPRSFRDKSLDIRSLFDQNATVKRFVCAETGETIIATPRDFSTGGLGWGFYGQLFVQLGGEHVECQVSMTVAVKGTKPGGNAVSAKELANNAVAKPSSDKAAGRKRPATRGEAFQVYRQYSGNVIDKATATALLTTGSVAGGVIAELLADGVDADKAKAILMVLAD